MRVVMAAVLSAAALGGGASASKPETAPFDGAWMSCETYQGARICGTRLLAQRGSRVCGIQRDFATNAYYQQRFVGTVQGKTLHIEKICGDPGSETDTYCAGQAPPDAAKVGWGTSDESLFLCNGRLHSTSAAEIPGCGKVNREAGLPRVGGLGDEGPEPEDRAWLKSCVGGAE